MAQDERRQLEELRRRVAHHDHRYHVLDDPEVSDAEYDALFRKLRELEERHPEWADPRSPIHRVGGEPVAELGAVEHVIPMQSLDNVHRADELEAFDARLRRLLERDALEYVAEPKYDGIAVELRYEAGALAVGSTRGNGRVGEDVTHSLRTVRAIPLELARGVPELLEVRGEVYMPIAAFQKLNRERADEGLDPYANPRNSTAGSLRQLDPRIAASRTLRMFAYGLGRGGEGLGVRSQRELLLRLSELGFAIAPRWEICDGPGPLLAFHERIERERENLPYEVDGSVVKLDDFALRAQAGSLDRSPRWAVAFKFPPRQATTRVLEIRCDVGRTGALTPVAVLEPVHLGGVTVSHASLHNQDEVERLDVRAGDRVFVERAGDVIPKVIKTVPDARPEGTEPYRLPEACPRCGTRTVRLEGEVAVRCPNAQCPAQVEERLRHFASREGLDVEGLGEELIHQLVERSWARRPSDLFALRAEKLAEIERWGEKSARNLVTALEAARRPTLARLLYALGIRHVGARISRVLAEQLGDLEAIADAPAEALQQIHEIGPTIAQSVRSYFESPENRAEIARLVRTLEIQPVVPASSREVEAVAGKTFVLTGTLSEPRAVFERRIREAGGKVTGSVSRKTDFVVAGGDPGSKRDKAERLGVQILDEAGLRDLLGAPPAG